MIRSTSLIFISLGVILIMGGYLSAQKSAERYFVGEKVCRSCHHLQGERNQFNPWRLTAHARAFSALFKPEAEQIALLSGINIPPFRSPICLGCHTTAYYTENWEREDTFHFEDGVQCERCHGAGSDYIQVHTMMDRKKSTQAGLMWPEKGDCLVCHKEKGSHLAVLHSRKFEYEQALGEIAHPGRGGSLVNEPEISVPLLPGPKYAGALACASCHGAPAGSAVYSKWHTSKHAQAYAILGGDAARKIAREMGVTGNPQKSDQCLKCHTTGGGEAPGRFLSDFDPAQGVQCESCHGAGSEYLPQAIMLDPVAARQAGLHDITAATCTGCHVPGIHGHSFDFDSMLPFIDHSKWEKTSNEPEYKTPFNLAISRDGNRLWVACEASNSLMVLNPGNGAILAEVKTGKQPHHVRLSPDGNLVFVSNRATDDVSVVDTRTYQVVTSIAVGDEPHEMAITGDGRILYVANAGTYDVSVVDVELGREIKRLAASRGPWGAEMSPDGKKVYISNNLPRFGKFRTSSQSEITVINTANSTIHHRYTVPDANLIQGIAVSPDEEFVLFTLIRTKSLVPMTRNIQGWVLTNGIGILWKDGRIDQLLLDQVNDGFADPTDVVFSRDGKYAFVSGGGVREVAVVDLTQVKLLLANASEEERREFLPNHMGISPQYVVARIPVGHSPRGMVISPDNKFLYVADGLDDAISVIDIRQRRRVRVLSLGGPQEITEARYGERIFHSADITYIRQFSCHSCHPDGGIDGITYDIEPDGIGVNPVDNRTLRGINDTAPFKWTGKNPSLKRQCGARLAAFFTRLDPFTPEESAALDRYIVTIPRSPNRYLSGGVLNETQLRGKRIFERQYDNSGNPIPLKNRCNFCHPPPYYTNREIFDVGTASPLDTDGRFDVPHLNNIYETPPYLHDGRANSLEEIWTVFNPDDTHGLTNDLTKDQLNDLIEYIKTL